LRIACLLDNGFEDAEFEKPYHAFRRAGHEVVIIGFEAGRELRGKRGEVSTTVDRAIQANGTGDFDALFLPGGYSPDHLRADERMVAFTKAFFNPDRPVFAICHGPQLLMTARVVRDRRMTAWKTIQDDLHQVGADVVDEEVVVDGRLVTSRQPSDVDAFIRESLTVLERQPAESQA
jgi:protease I